MIILQRDCSKTLRDPIPVWHSSSFEVDAVVLDTWCVRLYTKCKVEYLTRYACRVVVVCPMMHWRG
jgi:hypothetical protein